MSREVFLAGCAREGHPPARGAPVTPLLWLGQTGRSAFQCLQKFQQHNTALKRKEWTEQEDRMLTQLVQEMRVGSHIPYRKSKAVPGGPRPRPCLGPRPRPRAGGTRGWGWFLRGRKMKKRISLSAPPNTRPRDLQEENKSGYPRPYDIKSWIKPPRPRNGDLLQEHMIAP